MLFTTIQRKPCRQIGMTLVEILVAMLLGVFIIASLLQFFLSNRQTYRLMEGESRLQENGRYALELLSHDIRLAGYIGCSNISATNPIVIANTPLVAPVSHPGNTAVVAASAVTKGNDNTGSFTSPNPALSATLNIDVISNTDAITVQFGESCGGYTTSSKSDVTNPNTILPAGQTCVSSDSASEKGTPLIISNCSSAHIFKVSDDTSQNKNSTGTPTSSLAKTYAAGAEIMLFRSYTYYIRMGEGNQPALYRFNNNTSNSEEMIEGIENMQILYGIDTDSPTDGSANQYKASPTALEMQTAVSIRIIITARSIDDNITSSARTYTFNGASVSDRRLVKSFTSTISLRNR
jgi:type IV pilus assembly protein PilW